MSKDVLGPSDVRRSNQRLSREATRNRRDWNETAELYERAHGTGLAAHGGMSWGVFHAPEKKLRVLDEVRGKDVLELGCGAARWAIALARRGARVVGVDLSPKRLDQARRLAEQAHVNLTLVEASAESVPFPDRRFDVVFCDFGAMNFADPYRTVPEAARLLRPGGQLAFSTWSPIRMVFFDERRARIVARPRRNYFRMHQVDWADSVEFQLPYGEWIRLFRAHGFEVERLVELPAPRHLRSSYMSPAEARWGRTLPLESIWSVRRKETRTVHQRPVGRRSRAKG